MTLATLLFNARAILEGNEGLPLAVTYIHDRVHVSAKVTKLLAKYFEVEVPAYTTDQGGALAAQTIKLDYTGEPYGSRSQKTSKDSERRYGIKSPPGLAAADLVTVRKLSGRSAQ